VIELGLWRGAFVTAARSASRPRSQRPQSTEGWKVFKASAEACCAPGGRDECTRDWDFLRVAVN